ncbi:MAG: permease prefix domain 1-containing protein, partial [Gemmatimonadaceae bacterium]
MSVVTDLWERLRTLVFRGREDREMAEELRFHLEMEVEQNRRSGFNEEESH